MSEPNRQFEYLLNAMENAARHTNPSDHFYGDKRKAVFQHVAKLETDLAQAVAALRELFKDNEYDGRWCSCQKCVHIEAARVILAKYPA